MWKPHSERGFRNQSEIGKGLCSAEKHLFSVFKQTLSEQAHESLNLYTSPLMETRTGEADAFVSVDSVKAGKLTCYLGVIRL